VTFRSFIQSPVRARVVKMFDGPRVAVAECWSLISNSPLLCTDSVEAAVFVDPSTSVRNVCLFQVSEGILRSPAILSCMQSSVLQQSSSSSSSRSVTMSSGLRRATGGTGLRRLPPNKVRLDGVIRRDGQTYCQCRRTKRQGNAHRINPLL
jgi:hypothetical protein